MMRMRCCFPQRFNLTAVCAVTFRFQSSNVGPFGGYQRTHEPLVEAVSSWLTEAKGGNVFAAHDADQALLDAMLRYLDGSETKAPRCGQIPFKLSGSVEHDVLRHVFHRHREYDESSANCGQERTSLLCNSGFGGTGKTTLLHHTTVEAFRILKRMVGEHISIVTKDSAEEAKRAHEMRPLGFYATFNSPTTSSSADQKYLHTEEIPILTAIALPRTIETHTTTLQRESRRAATRSPMKTTLTASSKRFEVRWVGRARCLLRSTISGTRTRAVIRTNAAKGCQTCAISCLTARFHYCHRRQSSIT